MNGYREGRKLKHEAESQSMICKRQKGFKKTWLNPPSRSHNANARAAPQPKQANMKMIETGTYRAQQPLIGE